MNLMTRTRTKAPAPPCPPPPVVEDAGSRHVVEFYESDDFLVGTVAGFVGPALKGDDAAIVVATAAHRAGIDATLRASRIDIVTAAAERRYQVFDAQETLGVILVNGVLDTDRLAALVQEAVRRATAGGRRVRIYGEMVALLWDAGKVSAVMALEDFWNELVEEHGFSLLCAYPMRVFDSTARTPDFSHICDQHSRVIPSEQFAVLGGLDSQQRAVAQLQQEAAALRAELDRLRATQMDAELAYVEGLRARPPAPPAGWQDADVRAGRSQAAEALLLASQQANARPPASPKLYRSPDGRLLANDALTLSARLRYATDRYRPDR